MGTNVHAFEYEYDCEKNSLDFKEYGAGNYTGLRPD